MKNVLNLLVVTLCLTVMSYSVFAFTKSGQIRYTKGPAEAVVVVDPVTGNAMRYGVNKYAAKKQGAAATLTALVDNACIVSSIVVGGVSSGDWALISNGSLAKTTDYVMDIKVGVVNDSTVVTFPQGLYFNQEVCVTTTDSDVSVDIAYID